jgi:hypothetical protein
MYCPTEFAVNLRFTLSVDGKNAPPKVTRRTGAAATATCRHGLSSVQFVGNLMSDFVDPASYQPGAKSINIYPSVANTSKPLL